MSTEDDESLHHLLQPIDPVKEAFPVLRECLLIAMTLGASTATVERSFSSLRRLKTQQSEVRRSSQPLY